VILYPIRGNHTRRFSSEHWSRSATFNYMNMNNLVRVLGVCFGLTLGFNAKSQVIPNVPFAGPTGTSMVPTGWINMDGSPDHEALPTVPVWWSWSPDPGTLTGLPPGVIRLVYTHCLDHWGPSVIGGEAFGTSVSGLTPGETYSFTTYTGSAHYSGVALAGDVHSAMWAGTSIGAINAMGDTPTQIGRDVTIAPNFVAETWTFTATAATMWIVLGCESSSYRTYAHKGVLWAMIDPTLVTDDVCDDLVTAVSDTEVCFGETVTLDATSVNAGTITWDGGVLNGVAFAPPVGVTTYTATSSDAMDCVFSVEIAVHDLPIITAEVDDDSICLGEIVTFNGGGGIAYLWDIGVTDGVVFTPLALGSATYTVTGTDANGCENTASVDVLVSPIPVIDAGLDVEVCDGEPLTLTGSGAGVGGAYIWDGGVLDGVAFTPLTSGDYEVTGTSADGCSFTDFVTVTVLALPAINAGADQAICEDEMVTLSATGGLGYVWDLGVVDGLAFAPLATSTYTVIGTDINGCENTDTITVTVVPIPTINAGPDLEICLGEDVTLTATGVGVGGVYVWDGGVVNGLPFGPLATITYTVVGTTPEGCFSEDEVTITVNPSMTVSFTADELIGCAPFTVNFTSLVPGAIYNWNFGDGGSSSAAAPSHTYLTAGEFSVTLNMTNAAGCSGVVTYLDYITVIAQPIAAFTYSPTQVDVTDTEVQFTNQSLYATSYTWDFGDGAAISNAEHPIHVFPETGNVKYTVILTATNELGCVDVVQKVIEVKDVLIYYLPNSFTPDGDTYNELFSPIFYSGMDVYDFHFTIFNRWGELVFESFNTAYGWNGAYGDQGLVQDGVYIWRLEFGETMSDKKHTCEGHVTLIR
jgi:gliding motility-associated-like protein